MSECTPTPWEVHDAYSDTIIDGEGREIACCEANCPVTKESALTDYANAAFIVKAVNSHDALVKHLHHLATVCCDEDALRLLDSLGGAVGQQKVEKSNGDI